MKYRIILMFFCFLSFGKCVQLPKLSEGLVINPYDLTPLSAVYYLNRTNQQELTIKIQGKKDSLSVYHTFPAYSGNIFPIHGFYSDYTNKLTIFCGENQILDTNIVIPDVYEYDRALHPYVTNSVLIVHSNNQILDPFNQEFYFLYDNYTNIVAYDGLGDLRYLYRTPTDMYTMVRMEKEQSEFYFYMIDPSLKKVNLLGQEKNCLIDKAWLHHDFVYKNDNKIALATSPRGGLQDRVVEINPKGKVIRDLLLGDAIRNVLDQKDWHCISNTVFDTNNLATNRITLKEEVVDWAHANSLVYDQHKDILYVSLRHLGVLAISYENWKLIWWLADSKMNVQVGKSFGQVPANFIYLHDIPLLQKYRLISTHYPKNQHGLLLKKNGNLLLFDNQGDDVTNTSGSRILEYQLPEDFSQCSKATIVKNYRHPRRVYSRLLSDVDLVGDNHQNLLILWGFDTPATDYQTTRLTEINPNNKIITDISLRRSWVFRVEKKPFYPFQDTNKKYSVDVTEIELL